MKTKEFIKKVKGLGARPSDDIGEIDVYNSDMDFRLASVSYIHERRFVVTLDSDSSGLTKSEQEVLAKLVFEYGMTPLEERKDEQCWYIHLFEDADEYLNLQKDEGFYELSDKVETGSHKTKFTRSEIEDWAGTNSDEIIDWIIDKFGEEVKQHGC